MTGPCWRVPVRSSQARSIAPIVEAPDAWTAQGKAVVIAFELGPREDWRVSEPVRICDAGRHPVGVA